ncbi:hypothetical protein [Anaerovorax sp. IOR16]|uniref:hypothetical protein n=1 Tax=Anaerovorax sp. IOR16 TaxID=2773458 RepID=UPI0019CF9A20|nr:hypothetical protein [Anaerovorax sp. IOR16]
MQTLRQCYEEIASNTNRWSYYLNIPMSILDSLESDKDALEFIQKYFEFGGKKKVFKDVNLNKYKRHILERSQHIISTFFLGIKIAESFHIDTQTRNINNLNFKYYWFLACLYHDIGYAFEGNTDSQTLNMIENEGLEALQEICNIKYVHDRIFKTHPKEIVEFYFQCRAISDENKERKIDHGIAGGLLLYDKLRKQFNTAWKKRTNKEDTRDNFYIRDDSSGRELHLSNKHFDEYAKAADAIISHNIWISTLNQYIEKYGDSEGIVKRNNDRITINNELCFILSIADTIEPLKRDEKYLDLISIESLDLRKGFKLHGDNETIEIIYKNIESMKEWIEIKINIVKAESLKTSIEISIE